MIKSVKKNNNIFFLNHKNQISGIMLQNGHQVIQLLGHKLYGPTLAYAVENHFAALACFI